MKAKTERERFERWALRAKHPLMNGPKGERYYYGCTEAAWEGWQASARVRRGRKP
jgi:hypothetical protein